MKVHKKILTDVDKILSDDSNNNSNDGQNCASKDNTPKIL